MNRRGPLWWSLVLGVVLVVLGVGARTADAQCPNDCETNNPCLIGVCTKNECVFRVAQPGTVCRPSAGSCDVQEVCNGSSSICPNDTRRPAGTLCREANDPCEEDAVCSGSSTACPANPLSPTTKICQAASGPCDLTDRCNGTSRSCPPTFREEGALCRVAAGPCERDAECSGSGPSCPANPLEGTDVVCRLSDGACDQPESCTGASRDCPADGFIPAEAEIVCRLAASPCDAPEICDGNGGQCPGDRVVPDGSSCNADGDDCTADRCEDGECLVGAEADVCGGVDAGPDGVPDGGGGTPDAGESSGDGDAGTSDEPAEGGGCQVGITGSGGRGWPGVAALLAVLLGWKRRRSPLAGLGVLALAAACSGPADDGPPGPDPDVPPAGASSVCELSAGCPAGTHCDLGECIQLCSTDDPCEAGAVCSPRGRCLAGDAVDQDAPAAAEKPAELIAPDPWVLAVPASSNQVSFTLAAVPATAPVRYRVAPGAPWVRVEQARGEFFGQTTITLGVLRDQLPAGSHTASVVVHTSVGNVSLSVTLSNGFTGVYQGVITYESPARLGSLPLRLELREQDGQLLANIAADHSPSFARTGPTVFAVDAREGRLAGELLQVVGGDDLGGAESLLVSNPAEEPSGADRLGFYFGANRRFGRLWDVDLEPVPGGGLAGTFQEDWFGILGAPIRVTGTLQLERIPGEPGELELAPEPPLPPNPSILPPPAPLGDCSEAARVAGGYSAGYCDENAPAGQLLSCASSIRAAGYTLEDPDQGLLVPDGARGYAVFTNQCRQDLEAGLRHFATASDQDCFWLGNELCAQRLGGLAARTAPDDAARAMNREAADLIGVSTLLLNEALAGAFEVPYKLDDADPALADQMVALLASGRREARLATRYLFLNAPLLEGLATTPTTVAQVSGYVTPRRMAQFLDRYRMAFEEEIALRHRVKQEPRDVLRERLGQEILTTLLAYVTVGAVLEGQVVPSGGSADLVTEALTGLGRLHRELEEDGVPFALPVGYVPMLYDPSAVTPDRNTNLAFLLDYAAGALALAVSAEAEAQGATREYDINLDALTGELDRIQNARDERLVQLCGSAAGDPARPDLDECRTNPGGLFAQAAGELEEANLGVKSVLTSIDVQDRRVALHREMMIQIHGIREDTIRFVDATNQEIEQQRVHRGWFDAIQSIATFAVGAYTSMPETALQGAMGFGEAVIGGSIDRQIGELQAAKELRLLQSESDVEYVRLMTELAELEVQFLQLGVEVLLSVRRRMNAELRVAQIETELRAVRAQAALQSEQSLGSLANDPMFRVIRNRSVIRATFFKEDARRAAYLATLALDYELNLSFAHRDQILTSLSAGAGGLEDVLACMVSWSDEFRLAYGGGQSFSDEISLREDVFGIRGPVTDAVTGQTLSEAEQFRQMLLTPTHLGTGEVAVGMTFPTSIGRANPVFSPDVCNDQIESVQVKLIGDGLGDDQATVHLEQGGATFLRGCESYREGRGDVVREYHVIPDTAIIYAGVNGYPTTAPDTQLYGRAVAATDWTLALPRGQRNADVDFTRIEDIVVRVTHRAHSLSTGLSFAPACNL